MNKLILICLLFVVPTAFAATCTNSDLAEKVGLDALDTSVTSDSLTYCQGLETVDLCCSVDTINSLQATITTMVTETVLEAAARDSYLIAARTAVSAVSSTFKTLQTSAVAASTKLTAAATAANADEEEALADRYTSFVTALTPLTTIYDSVEEGLGASDNWDKYQAARATCANKVFEAQATVLCLACRAAPAAYATFTSDDVTDQLVYTTDYEEALSAACYPYLTTYAPEQNTITFPFAFITNVASLNTLVASLNTADVAQATAANLVTLTGLLDVDAPTDDYQEIPSVSNCGATKTCSYAYTDLLAQGTTLVPEYLANGGSIEIDASSSSRLLGEARTLTAVVFDPTSDDNASGVTVDFPADVIAAASAWRQGGLMTCVVALVAMLLF